jgi:hypothetical protein
MGWCGRPEEVVVFLCSSAASFVNGATSGPVSIADGSSYVYTGADAQLMSADALTMGT